MTAFLTDPDSPRCSDAADRGEGRYDDDTRCACCGDEDCTDRACIDYLTRDRAADGEDGR